MDETRSAAMTGAAMKQFQERRAAARHAAIVVAGTDSPQVLESTLSQISDEVTQEAIERRRLAELGR